MRNGSGVLRHCAVVLTAAVLCGCGGDAGLTINSPTCSGGDGPEIKGIVEMPRGRVAQTGSLLERVAGRLWSEAAAITGAVSPVGANVRVELAELRPDDLPDGPEPGPVAISSTRQGGQYCIGLPEGTDENVCRFVVRVGTSADRTLTRAFVFSTTDTISIDFLSEATVRVILAQIPPAGLCDFSPDDIQNIYQAVLDAPGTATGETADEINATAASIAAADPGVQAAIAAALRRPTVPPTSTAVPSTPTPIVRASDTPTARATRTPTPP